MSAWGNCLPQSATEIVPWTLVVRPDSRMVTRVDLDPDFANWPARKLNNVLRSLIAYVELAGGMARSRLAVFGLGLRSGGRSPPIGPNWVRWLSRHDVFSPACGPKADVNLMAHIDEDRDDVPSEEREQSELPS